MVATARPRYRGTVHGRADDASRRDTTSRINAPVGALVLVGLLVLGCSSSAPSSAAPTDDPTSAPPTPSPTVPSSPTPRATPTPTHASSPSPTSAAVDLSFSSTVYPYSIVLPADALDPGPIAIVPAPGTWRPATIGWDGTTVISPSQPDANDSTVDSDGDELFVVGHPTDDDLAAFAARMIDDFAMWHRCSRTPASRTTEVDGEPAMLIASPCSQGGASAVAARAFVVHDGFGLIFNTRTFRSVEAEAQMDRLARYVAGVDLLP